MRLLRSHIFSVMLVALFCFVYAFTPVVPQPDKKAVATVQQVEGLYVFMLCRPLSEVKSFGTVKVGMSVTDDPLHTLIKKTKKEYPEAEGIIISDPDLQKAHAEAISFK